MKEKPDYYYYIFWCILSMSVFFGIFTVYIWVRKIFFE